jgi:hypothetical protein
MGRNEKSQAWIWVPENLFADMLVIPALERL